MMTRPVFAVRTRSFGRAVGQLAALPCARRCGGVRFLSRFYRDLVCGLLSRCMQSAESENACDYLISARVVDCDHRVEA